MTIILQNQSRTWWVDGDVEVGLSFGGIPETAW